MTLIRRAYIACMLLIALSITGNAQLRLPRLISNGMVLQRDTEIRVWGWANPNESVSMEFLDEEIQLIADATGAWSFILPKQVAGGPYEMILSTGDSSITIHDILIGDVWICSGQSQMDIPMDRVSPLYEEEIRQAGNENIHYFQVPAVYNFKEPQEDHPYGNWESISQKNILKVSAIAYFFALELYELYNVPVGMIRSSVGGSPAESWLSEDALKQFPAHYMELQKFKSDELIQETESRNRETYGDWYSRMNETDQGYEKTSVPWHHPETDVSEWPEMEVPGYWADGELGQVNGSVWFRKDLDIPEEMAGKPARLNLGRIVDADSAFVNGVYVGSVSYQYPPRRYHIPENVLKAGKNILVVRVISNGGRGGFVLDKPYELIVEKETIELSGTWKYHLGAAMEPMKGTTFIRNKPTGLYNGMIAPLTNLSFKGVLWYQGESNAGRPLEYIDLFPAVIKDWRAKWGVGDFPFLYAQLHNYMESYDHPTESGWALTREAQLKTLSLPNTAMIVAIDLGEWNDIHPMNKQDVAKRFLLAARKVAYDEDIVSSGPMYESMEVKGKKIILHFKEIGSGLEAKGSKELSQFAIAGEDQKYVWAKAKIIDNKIIVWSKEVRKPVAVRYAWADNPEGANLYNEEGLPASPFRTDNWEE